MDRLQIPDLVVGAGRRAAAGNDPPAVCALLLDAAGYWRRVETCGLEPTIPVPAGFCGGSAGVESRFVSARIANVLYPLRKQNSAAKVVVVAKHCLTVKKPSLERKNGRERGHSHGHRNTNHDALFSFFPPSRSTPLGVDIASNRWVALINIYP